MKRILSGILGLVTSGVTVLQAQVGPGWFNMPSDPLETVGQPLSVAPASLAAMAPSGQMQAQASSGYTGPITAIVQSGQPVISEEITPEISALARNLENDPKRIYDYVHNYISYVHYFGSKKGALLTLLEKSGNDFDQCALLTALLRAAKQNTGIDYKVTYQFGVMSIPYQATDGSDKDLKHWLSLKLEKTSANFDDCRNRIQSLNRLGGFPKLSPTRHVLSAQSDINNLIFHRVWVKLVCPDSSTYYLDPAFKISTPISGIDVASAMQLNTVTLLGQASVGAEVQSPNQDYIKDINWNNLSSQLTTYTANLLSDLQNNTDHQNLSVEQVIGGSQIQELETQTFAGLPFAPLQSSFTTSEGAAVTIPILEWENIPSLYMSTMRLQIDNVDVTYKTPALKGRKVTLTFANSQAVISLDDIQDKIGSSGSGINGVTMTTSIAHPFGTWDYINNVVGNFDGRTDQGDGGRTYLRNAPGYVVAYGFDNPNGQLTRRQEQLNAYIRQGLSSTSTKVITETLNVIGLTWLQETYLASKVLEAQKDVIATFHHRVGRVAQESPTSLGYYIDLPIIRSAYISQTKPVSSPDDESQNVFRSVSLIWSAMEHGVIEQLQGVNAASTIKTLYLANASHQKLILGTSANATRVSSYLDHELVNPYTSAEKSDLVNFLTGGVTMLLASGKQTINSWKGYGCVELTDVGGGTFGFGLLINGSYGGYAGVQAYVDPGTPDVYFVSSPFLYNPTPPSIPITTGADPVNMSDGSFTLNSVDLSVGQAEPRGFSFARHYDSNRRHMNGANMANGWTHNYAMQATERSDPAAGLGQSTPQAMAAFLASVLAAYEVYTQVPDASNPQCKLWAVAALISEWGVDQLKNNAVSVAMGADTVQFIKQPNNTYTPPPGISMTLTKPNGYWLQQRHGNTFKFDPTTKKIKTIVDPYGKTMTFNYSTSGILTSIVDCWGANARTLTLTYSGSRLESITDGTGRSVSFTYDTTYGSESDLVSVTDPEGKVWSFEYDNDHKITKTKDATIPSPRVIVQNIYDSNGKVIQQKTFGDNDKTWNIYAAGPVSVQVDPKNGRTVYYYDEHNRVIAVIDPNKKMRSSVYDGQDHLIQSTTPEGEITQYTYDGRNNLTKIIDPQLHEAVLDYNDATDDLETVQDFRKIDTKYDYDTHHKVLTTTYPNVNNDSTMPSVVSCTYYPDTGNLHTQTDQDGKVTTFEYDNRGALNKITYHNLENESFVYNVRGDCTSHTDARGITTTYQYNKLRQRTRSELAVFGQVDIINQWIYDDCGNLWKQIDGNNNTTLFTYSPTKKLLTTTFPAVDAGTPLVVNHYDERDWLQDTTDPRNKVTQYGYDAAGHLVTVTDPLQHTVTYEYDDNGQRISVASPLRDATKSPPATQITTCDYNERGEKISSTDPAGFSVNYSYDENGNPLTIKNRNNGTFINTYYDDNRVWTSQTPLMKVTSRTYNQRGLVKSITDPMLHQTSLYYDDRSRLQTLVDPVGSISFEYDGNNNLESSTENGNSIVRSYNALNQIDHYFGYIGDQQSSAVCCDHDNCGNVTRIYYHDSHVVGRNVEYDLDGLGRVRTVTDWAHRVTSFTYDLAGRLTSINRPNNTVRNIEYDDSGHATSIQELTQGGRTPIAVFNLEYDEAGRVTSEFAAPMPTVTAEASAWMNYDADNRITRDGVVVTHDDNGNMTSGPLNSTSVAVSYAYDARNRLISVGACGTAPALTYGYDSEGNRTSITQGGQTTTYVVSPFTALPQVLMRTKNGTTTYYVYGAGMLLYQVDDSENVVTYHYDCRGSTVALTGADGQVTDRVEYSSYGTVTKRTGTTDTPFLFNGAYGVMTDPNGLCYMRARYYNPYLRRFLNADPSGFDGGFNRYAYADGNPISFIDPFGLCAGGNWEDGSGTRSWLAHHVAWPIEEGLDTTWNLGMCTLFTPPSGNSGDVINLLGNPLLRMGCYLPSDYKASNDDLVAKLAVPSQELLFSFGGSTKSESDLFDAYESRDAAMRESGRKYATYIGGTKNGIVTVGQSGGGACAEDYVASVVGPDAVFTSAAGWRGKGDLGDFTIIETCSRCRGKYDYWQWPWYQPNGWKLPKK